MHLGNLKVGCILIDIHGDVLREDAAPGVGASLQTRGCVSTGHI